MRIAICDDCPEDIKYLEKLILASEFCSKDIVFFEYVSGETLLENDLDFDAIFLDIQMQGMDGKLIAEHIRERDSEVLISFYSGFETAANQILRSRPYSYLMKILPRKSCPWRLAVYCVNYWSGKGFQGYPLHVTDRCLC